MKRTIILAILGVLFSTPIFAQAPTRICVVNANGGCQDVAPTYPFPVSILSGGVQGGFTAAAEGTPISVTTGGVSGTLPAGSIVVATNVGAANGAYCSLGASADTGGQYLSPGGGWFAFQVGAATQLTCITGTSTTTVNMVGGSGLPTGTGGGGGSSGLPAGAATSANQATEITALQALVSGLLTPPIQTISGGTIYNTIAASQTAQVMTGGSGGATGDYLSHCVIYPTSTSPGVLTVFDNASAAGTNVIAFPGGASSTSNLAPITIPVGAFSVAGPWKVTTGANMVATCYGKFH